MNRRRFLKYTGSGAAVLLLSSGCVTYQIPNGPLTLDQRTGIEIVPAEKNRNVCITGFGPLGNYHNPTEDVVGYLSRLGYTISITIKLSRGSKKA